MSENRGVGIAIGCAVTAVLMRLVALHWLHPVNWDEIEFFCPSRWIAQGQVPFRDFWEHHSPLAWFVFAPIAAMTNSVDTRAIIAMRWAQLPLWIAVFCLALVFMRNAGLSRFARWSAIAVTVASSLLMTSAIEFRVDPLAIALYLGGLVAWQRGTKSSMFLAGALFCLAGMSNLRLGPLLVCSVLLLRLINRRDRSWKGDSRANWIFAGGVATLLICLLYFAATSSWSPMWQQLFVENAVGESTAPGVRFGFLNRLMSVFGLHVIVFDRVFEPGAIDVGGITLLLAGLAGIVTAMKRWRHPDDLFVVAVFQVANTLFLIRMKYVYNYHFQIMAVLMLPLLALVFERMRRRESVIALVLVAWCVNAYASILRGKEEDRAYQDVIMREVDARTKPGETYFAGIPWALHRQPAYRFWFLPELARQLVLHRHAAPYSLQQIVRNPPAAFIADRNALGWLAMVQRELGPYFYRHYTPLWRSLWIPGMNAVIAPAGQQRWIVPRTGEYHLYVSASAVRHPWFRYPISISIYGAKNAELRLPAGGNMPELHWMIDGASVAMGDKVTLQQGSRISVMSTGSHALAVFLLNSTDRVIFRQPPKGVTLEAASPRVTHWPSFR